MIKSNRITAVFLSAFLLLTTLTGCSQKNTEDNANASDNSSTSQNTGTSKAAKALDISLDHSYKSEKIDTSSLNLSSFTNPIEINGNLLMTGYDPMGKAKTVLYNLADKSFKDVDLEYVKSLDDKTDYYISYTFLNPENQVVFVYGAYRIDESNEENPYEDLGMTLEIYDQDLKLVETKSLKDTFNQTESENPEYLQFLTCDAEGNYIACVQSGMEGVTTLNIYDKDFNKKDSFQPDVSYINQMFPTSDGKLAVLYQDNEYQNCYGIYNPEKKSIDKMDIANAPRWYNNSFAGKKDYDVLLSDSNGVYGVKFGENSCQEAVNWINSDFSGDSISNVTQLSDGRFFVYDVDYTGSGDSNLWLLSERDPEELKNVQLITLSALYLPTELSLAVNQFNRTHTDCRIGVLNYDKYSTEENAEAGLEKFQNDMTSGIVADIICLNNMPYESYANKGLLLDLTDKVKELNSDDYFTNFFDALKYGDKLYRIGFSYTVQTLEAKTENVQGKSGLSVKEFSDLLKNLPEGMQAFQDMSKDNAMYQFCIGNINAFVDVNNMTCSFNSPEFAELLELCNSYPADTDDARNGWTDEQWEKYWAEEGYQYINNKTLFMPSYISDIRSYLTNKATYFDKADTTLVGFPTMKENSNGGRFQSNFTVSISANSAVQEQAWEFCKNMLSEESQDNLNYGFPVSKKAFDKIAAEALKPQTYTDENGQEVTAPNTIYRGNEEIEMPPITQTDIDKIKTYISSVNETAYYNEKISNIIQEEAQKFFAGDQTAQAAADMIQSRASLYLSEQT